MEHEPILYEDGPQHYWFECSCSWIGDWRPHLFGASNQWKFHMADIVNLQVREAVERTPKRAMDN